MRYAIISDIHGNLEGLNTVMEHAKSNGVDKFVCGGDVVGYNANPKECMDIVRGLDMPCVMGNHDEYIGQGLRPLCVQSGGGGCGLMVS